MRQVLTRTAGVLLIVAGVAGVLFSVIALVVFSRFLSNIQASADRRITQIDRALAATGDGLVVAQNSLDRAETTMRSLRTTIDGASQAITDTLPALDRVGVLVGEDLPTTITSTRSALASAQETARVLAKLQHLDDHDRKLIEQYGEALVNKLLHGPSAQLRHLGGGDRGVQLASALRYLFRLDEAAPQDKGAAEDEQSAPPRNRT